jgi:hypothetical protein
VQQQVVASVNRAGMTLTFLSVPGPDGGRQIQLFERGSLAGPASPVPALIAHRLTSQEIYLALAPRGAVAPAALAGLQATEAAALGRDAGVRMFRAAPAAPATLAGPVASSAASCQSHVLGDITDFAGLGVWSNKSATSYPSGNQNKFVGGLSGYETTNFVGFGGCNEGTTSLTTSWAVNQRWNNLGWQQSGTFPVGPGGYAHWYYKWHGTDDDGDLRGASYQVKGSSSTAFVLVTGEWFTV